MSKISRERGKRYELQVAKYLETHRNHFEAEDVRHPLLSVECKHRTNLPKSVTKWYKQAVAAAEPGKVPVVAMHEQYQLVEESLCVITLKDLKKLIDNQ